jgi:signal transduction histidine kinase
MRSLSWKLSALFLGVMAVFAGVNMLLLQGLWKDHYRERYRSPLEDRLEVFSLRLVMNPDLSVEKILEMGSQGRPLRLTVCDPVAGRSWRASSDSPNLPEDLLARTRGEEAGWFTDSQRGRELYFRRVKRGTRDLILLTTAPMWGFRPKGGSRSLFPLRLFLLLAAAVIAGLVGVRFITGRLSRLREGLQRLEEGDLTIQLVPGQEDEVGDLIHSFNALVESLRRAREEIASQDRARRELLADVSHELSTPLTGMLCHLELLAEGAESMQAEDRARIQVAIEEGGSLAQRIQDLLTLAREDVEAFPLKLESINVQRLLQDLANRTRSLCETSGVELVTLFQPEIYEVQGDADRLEQVFRNLLENARRALFDGGRIEICVLPPEQGELVVEIRDDGPGIAEEVQKTLFDRFQRGAGGCQGGTGLGLAIVKRIVERHGGRCVVESTVGEGSCFRVLLAMAPSKEEN